MVNLATRRIDRVSIEGDLASSPPFGKMAELVAKVHRAQCDDLVRDAANLARVEQWASSHDDRCPRDSKSLDARRFRCDEHVSHRRHCLRRRRWRFFIDRLS